MSALAPLLPTLTVVLGLAATGMAAWAVRSGKTKPLAVAGGLAALAVLCGVGWATAETEADRVKQRLRGLRDAVVADDPDRVVAHFTPDATPGELAIRGGMALFGAEDDLELSDWDVTLSDDDTRAVVRVRAYGTFTYKAAGSQRFPTFWELTLTRTGEGPDAWRIEKVQRLDPIRGEPIGLLSAR